MFMPDPARVCVAAALLLLPAIASEARQPAPAQAAPIAQSSPAQITVTCASKPGERTQCAADTSAGVVLVRSSGTAACLLGKTWGYDQTSIWVSDGCSADFATASTVDAVSTKIGAPRHVPNVGFLIFDGEKGQIYLRLFTYARYLNQRALDESYVDAFGTSHTVQRRQDVQLQKFFLPFSGWFLTPKMLRSLKK